MRGQGTAWGWSFDAPCKLARDKSDASKRLRHSYAAAQSESGGYVCCTYAVGLWHVAGEVVVLPHKGQQLAAGTVIPQLLSTQLLTLQHVLQDTAGQGWVLL